ncbi:hypothetical protein PhaeoP59_00163 [Phaeobacter inhibens]|nr:hypothetical protein PhaeoP59_00163 [Phaeobacter inhibens]
MFDIGTLHMGIGDVIYDGEWHIGGIAPACNQNSREPRLIVPRVEHVPFTSEKYLHPRGEVARRMRERLTNVAQISGVSMSVQS